MPTQIFLLVNQLHNCAEKFISTTVVGNEMSEDCDSDMNDAII